MIPRVVWVPDVMSLDVARRRISAATATRFEEPVGLWLRLYGVETRAALGFLEFAQERAHRSAMTLVVGMRLDLAIAAGADGVHLPSHGLSVDEARRLAPTTGFLVGASCHDDAELARSRGADYVTVSPFAASPGKATPLGRGGLSRLRERASAPVLALGGITLENLDDALAAGVHGVAVKRAIDEADDPHRSICGFLRRAGRPRLG